jgi:hypothetical protein
MAADVPLVTSPRKALWFALVGAAFTVACVAWTVSGDDDPRAPLGIVCCGVGTVVMLWRVRRPHTVAVVSDEGLRVAGLFRAVEVPWHRVVSIEPRRHRGRWLDVHLVDDGERDRVAIVLTGLERSPDEAHALVMERWRSAGTVGLGVDEPSGDLAEPDP